MEAWNTPKRGGRREVVCSGQLANAPRGVRSEAPRGGSASPQTRPSSSARAGAFAFWRGLLQDPFLRSENSAADLSGNLWGLLSCEGSAAIPPKLPPRIRFSLFAFSADSALV